MILWLKFAVISSQLTAHSLICPFFRHLRHSAKLFAFFLAVFLFTFISSQAQALTPGEYVEVDLYHKGGTIDTNQNMSVGYLNGPYMDYDKSEDYYTWINRRESTIPSGTTLPTITRERCIFKGWYFDGDPSQTFTQTPRDIEGKDTKINALWEPIPYVLTLDFNGGTQAEGYTGPTITDNTITYTVGDADGNATTSFALPTLNDKDDATFIGWKTGEEGSETLIVKGAAVFPKAKGNEDAAYTAVFVSYIDENGAAQKLPEGWKLLTNSGSLDGSCYVVFGNQDFATRDITFTTTDNEVKLIFLDGARLTANNITAEGKTLSIYTQNTGDNAGTVKAGGKITAQTLNAHGGNIDAKIADGTAVDIKNNASVTTTYTVTFNSNAGEDTVTLSMDNLAEGETFADNVLTVTVNYGTTAKAKEPTVSDRPGYRLTGWKTNAEGEGDNYDFDTALSDDLVLYANWKVAHSYILTLNLGGVSATLDDNSYKPNDANNPTSYTRKYYDDDVETFTLPSPSSTGNAKFLGWKLDEAADDPETTGATDPYQEETSEELLPDVTIDPSKEEFHKDSSYTAQWNATYYSSPKFMAHSLTLSGGYIAVDFYVYIPEAENLADNDGTKVVFTLNGQDTEAPLDTTQAEEVGGKNCYIFSCPINSIQIADNITAKLFLKNSTEASAEHSYSVVTYLDNIIKDTSTPDKLMTLVKAIKDYGHYVQIPLKALYNWEFGEEEGQHKEIECADDNISSDIEIIKGEDGLNIKEDGGEVSGTYKIENGLKGNETDSGISELQYTLVLDSTTTIELYLVPSAATPPTSVTAKDGTGEAKTLSLGTYAIIGNKSAYKFETDGIYAQNLDKTHEITITVNGSKSYTVKVSAFSYVHSVLADDNAKENDLKNAVIALYKYCKATQDYRNQ